MKLQIIHAAPYLLHNVKVERIVYKNERFKTLTAYDFCPDGELENLRLILRPLSDLTKEIEVNGKKFVPIVFFEVGDEINEEFLFEITSGNVSLIKLLESISKHNLHNEINYLAHVVVQKLLEWNFDVFGLIEAGLAININSIDKKI